MKQIKLRFLLLMLAFCAISTSAHDIEVDGIYYNIINGNEASVTYSNEYTGDVYIPSTIIYNGITYSVNFIGDHAFEYCSGLTSVTIPNSVTTIGDEAFEGCCGLNDVFSFIDDPTTVSMGSDVFYQNPGNYAERTLHVPVGTMSAYQADIKWSDFFGSIVEMEPNEQDSIIVFADENVKALCVQNWDTNGDGELSMAEAAAVTKLGYVFNSNQTITSFNELRYFTGLTSIGPSEFVSCTALTSITIPNTVTTINAYEFNASGLTSIIIPESVISIGAYAFSFCSSLSSVTISNSVRTIEMQAFRDCTSMTTVSIPSSVTSIGDGAFAGCSGITNISVDSDNTIYDSRDNCNAIIETATSTLVTGCKNSSIPSSVTAIGHFAFYGCSLTSINIPNSVTSFGDAAFSCCRWLTSIDFPNSVTTIGDYAFFSCTGLASVTIPNSVTSIGKDAFGNCNKLTRIIVNSNNPVYDSRENSNAIIETVTNTLITGCKNTVIPGSVTTIGVYAFDGCSGLTSVTIPNSVTSIGDYAFRGCTGLASLDIANSVTFIGSFAFSNCSGLTSVNIPNSVTEIGDYAFWYCSGLKDVFSFIEDPTTVSMGSSVFYREPNNYAERTLHVPVGTVSVYQADTKWSIFFGSIVEMGGNPQDSIIVFADANVKAICVQNWDTNCDGELSMAEAAAVTTLNSMFMNNRNITSFNELKYFCGLTTIENNAFESCNKLMSISIPNSCKKIGNYAFRDCSRLTSIDIPNSVTRIGQATFWCCDSLKSISIPPSVTYIGLQAFSLSGLTNVTIPISVTFIDRLAFEACRSLESIIVINGNTNYDSRNNCNAIIETASNTLIAGCKNTSIPNNISVIGEGAFLGCFGLTSITIPNSVKAISDRAFSGCISLTGITIPNSVSSIGFNAFGNCSSLTSLTIPSSVNSIGDQAFYQCGGLASINVATGNIIYDSRNNCNAIVETASNTLIAGCKNTNIPNSVTSIGNYAFAVNSGLTNIVIPNSVTSIGDWAFCLCDNLKSITLPNSITSIGNGTFSGCHNLSNITIPNSVISIGRYAFSYCRNLKSVTVPYSVTSIGDEAFYCCYGLTDVYSFIPNVSDVTTGTSLFYRDPSDYSGRTLHVPSGTANAYQADENWYPYFGQIVEMVSTTSINLDKSSAVITVGDTMQLNATVLPEDAENKSVSWTSNNPLVATIDSNGLVTAVAHGTATITATTTDGTNLSDSCMVIVTADLSENDNYLSLEDTTVFHGDIVVIPIAMTNAESIISFQTDIFLPEGLEIMREDGDYIIDPSDRMTRTHSVMSNDISTGAIRVLCFSSNYKPFTGNSGDDLFYITVKVADDAEGDYVIQLKNTLFTTSAFEEIAVPDVAATVNVKAYILGDANDSRTVTVTDVVVSSQYVLEMDPQPFNFRAADVNEDGNITVTDVSRIAWMVLNPTLNVPRRAPAVWNDVDRMSGEDVALTVGETRTVSIALDNTMAYNAFQLDLKLPDGLTAGNFCLTDRAGSHAFYANTLSNGKTRVLCYSPTLTAISGNEGALLTFDVKADADVDGIICVDGIELVTTDCQTVLLDGFTIGVNAMTSVNELATSKTIAKFEYFNLAGQQIDRPESGVTLVVTTYTDGTRTTTKVIQ